MHPRATTLALCIVLATATARGEQAGISYTQALALARRSAPELAVARESERVARSEIGIATTYPNPTLVLGTSTQTARFSADLSLPLVVFGQRGTARMAASADLEAAQAESAVTWLDVRAATAHAFVKLWLAQRSAAARAEIARLVERLDDGVSERVRAGTAPELDGLRAHSERLRAETEATESERLVAAAAAELGVWVGELDGSALRATGDPPGPGAATLNELARRLDRNPEVVRQERAEHAALLHADAESALARPALSLELGVDAYDPTLPATNYRAGLGLELPLFNQRGAYVERERAAADVARERQRVARVHLSAELVAAFRRTEALSGRVVALQNGVVPAAESAASALEDAYTLGRVPLASVLDAEQSRITARLDLLEARADRADAWIDVERAAGVVR